MAAVSSSSRLPRTAKNLKAVSAALPPFDLDGRSRYHHVLSLVLSQRVRFSTGQRTRRQLYTLLGEGCLDNLFARVQERPAFVEEGKWRVMRAAHEAWPHIDRVPGIGPWTLACAHHMAGEHAEGGFVRGDRAVQRVVQQLFEPGPEPSALLPRAEAGELFARLWQLTRGDDAERAGRVGAVLRDVHGDTNPPPPKGTPWQTAS